MVNFRTIRYMKKKDIIYNGVDMSDDADMAIQNADDEDSMVLRLMIDDFHEVHIEYAAKISIENIRDACNLVDDVSQEKSEVNNG